MYMRGSAKCELPTAMNKKRTFLVIGSIVLYAVLFVEISITASAETDLYFPPMNADWETVSLEETGWDASKLDRAVKYVGEQNSSGIVILYRGRILVETYWNIKPAEDRRSLYKYMLVGSTSDGRAIEDVASVQKSVISFLAAMARVNGKLDIDSTVARYLGDGWSKASLKQESNITVKHLMSMTSGLDESLHYKHPAGTVWDYNTTAYSMMIPVLAKAAGMDINQLTSIWLTSPVGMLESRWETRRWLQNVHAANTIGFVSSARDLARFGLLVLAEGKWGGKAILRDSKYLHESLTPSQNLKPSYGYLWWILKKYKSVAAFGKLTRMVVVIPDKQIVIVRLGDQIKDSNRYFRDQLFKLLVDAMPDQ